MAQWVNRLRNNIFVNPLPLPLLCEIFGALHLAQLDLTTGRLAGWLAGIRNTACQKVTIHLQYLKLKKYTPPKIRKRI